MLLPSFFWVVLLGLLLLSSSSSLLLGGAAWSAPPLDGAVFSFFGVVLFHAFLRWECA